LGAVTSFPNQTVGGDIVAKLYGLSIFIFLIFVSCLVQGQEGNASVFLPNQEVRVADLPALTAPSKSSSAVLTTVLETVLNDKTVCCGRDSALEDSVLYAAESDPVSLQELSAKLRGRHLLSDGRHITVSAEYFSQSSIYANLIVRTLLDQHAPLIAWKTHLYVLYGAIFDETRYYSGPREYAIHKLFLLDPRFSDQRREIVFNRDIDDWGKVEGLLTLAVSQE
jgi:hypothetical protein